MWRHRHVKPYGRPFWCIVEWRLSMFQVAHAKCSPNLTADGLTSPGTCYMWRRERTGCIVPDFPIQAPIYFYPKTAIMHRSITELRDLHHFSSHDENALLYSINRDWHVNNGSSVYSLHIAQCNHLSGNCSCLPSESPYRQMLFEVHSDQCLLLEGMKKMQNKSESQLQNHSCKTNQNHSCKTNQNHSCAQSLQVSYACYNWGYRYTYMYESVLLSISIVSTMCYYSDGSTCYQHGQETTIVSATSAVTSKQS